MAVSSVMRRWEHKEGKVCWMRNSVIWLALMQCHLIWCDLMQGDTGSYCAAAINDAAPRWFECGPVWLMVIEWLSGSCFKKRVNSFNLKNLFLADFIIVSSMLKWKNCSGIFFDTVDHNDCTKGNKTEQMKQFHNQQKICYSSLILFVKSAFFQNQ